MSTDDETPRQRLERLRAEHAQLIAQTASAPLPVRPGDEIHVLKSGLHVHTGGGGMMTYPHTTKAGETICLTEAMIAASRNAGGWSWMSLIGDDEAQIRKWGEVRFRLGRAPQGMATWGAVNDSDWTEQRAAARRDAWAQPTREAQAEALRAVYDRFGPAAMPPSLTRYTDPTIAAAAEQQRQLAEGGVRLRMDFSAQEPGVRR